MTRSQRILMIAALAVFFGGCSKHDDEAAKKAERSKKVFVDVCLESSASLAHPAAHRDDQTTRLVLENAMLSCSRACDLRDQPSCARLDHNVRTLCGAAPNACESLCKKTSGSLKDSACGAANAATTGTRSSAPASEEVARASAPEPQPAPNPEAEKAHEERRKAEVLRRMKARKEARARAAARPSIPDSAL